MTKQIELTQGLVALVDNEDYKRLNKYKWRAYKNKHTFYACRNINLENGKQTTVQMHREILGLVPGDGKITDHRNRDGLDNRRLNLRIVSRTINNRNHRKRADNSSGHNGVHWETRDKKWRVQIGVDGKLIRLGYYDELDDAVEARKQGELKYWEER